MSRALNALILTGLLLFATHAASQEQAAMKRHHALSLIGEPKYPADFKHFDYANPNAPKGGTVRLWDQGSFDTLNIIPRKGEQAAGLALIYDQLLETSLDEASTEYGLLAEWVSHPEDYSSVTFKLRAEARWHDGKPVTPEDVIFSMDILKKGNENLAQYYKNVVRSEKTGEREVTFFFDVKNNKELPLIVGQLTVLPAHYWQGAGQDGQPRDPLRTTLEIPLGSGPYKIKSVAAGSTITYERVANYWAKDLPVRRGYYNFDTISYQSYRDSTPAFEAFKKGDLDYFDESSAKNWATAYEFPALSKGLVVKRNDIALQLPQPMQAFIPNTRRAKFADPRVRRALNLVFNFEWANRNLFYGQYRRVSSYFENTELAGKGLPQGLELQILEELRDIVPPEVFTTEYQNPVNSDEESAANAQDEGYVARPNLREATKLISEAGWSVQGGVLKNAGGEPFQIEFLIVQPAFERIVNFYSKSLKKLGIASSIRVVDVSQYQNLVEQYNFDMITGGFRQSESPGNEQRFYWGSEAADKPGSRNVIGIKNPAVDKLIDKIIFAKTREELVAASRALDRVLLWNHYLVPQWYAPNERIAYWDRYASPQTLPSRAVGFLQVWWQDPEKAQKLQASR